MRKLVLKKCLKCGALVKVINDCTCDDCSINCCSKEMSIVKENSVDASFEKHIPTYEIVDEELVVTVNHVMDNDHYIEWICLVNDEFEEFVYFKPNEEVKAVFNETKGTLYSYCNKHGLWMKDIR